MNLISVIIIVILFLFESIWVKEESNTYKVAIVSYHNVDLPNMTPKALIDYNTEQYLGILNNISQELDLIVYPEATLDDSLFSISHLDLYTTVPPPDEKATPCRAADGYYPEFFKSLSCAAKNRNVNMVVNIVEKEKCDFESGHCADYGYNLYNTDVMFDRRGMIVARYRKYHLFGEHPKNTTAEPDYTTVDTDFGVSFGFFTCFDILFQKPPLELVKRGMKQFIFPTLWFSELPFLTALQTQQMWSEENDVVLLAANGNNPRRGSGGSGVYIGKSGPVTFDITTVEQNYVLIADVPKQHDSEKSSVLERQTFDETSVTEASVLDAQDSDDIIDKLAKEMDPFKFLRDELQAYKSVVIDFRNNEGSKVICDGEGDDRLCCNFKYKTSVDKTQLDPERDHYTYHMMAFSGVRSFAGVSYGGMENCAIVACLDENVATCGKRSACIPDIADELFMFIIYEFTACVPRYTLLNKSLVRSQTKFEKYTNITWPLTFDYIKIEATFTNVETKRQFPNSLLSSIRPINPSFTSWESESIEGGTKIHRKHQLNKPQNRLMTFAIYGRDFSRDQVIPVAERSIMPHFEPV